MMTVYETPKSWPFFLFQIEWRKTQKGFLESRYSAAKAYAV